MIQLPSCTTKNSIIGVDLAERASKNQVIKLVVVHLSEEGLTHEAGNTYLVTHLTDEPQRPIYVATRRDRTQPKIFIDQTRLLRNLARDFEGIPVQLRQV